MDRFVIGDLQLKMDLGEIPTEKGMFLEKFRSDTAQNLPTVTLKSKIEDLRPYYNHVIRGDNGVYTTHQHHGEQLMIYHWGRILNGFAVWPDRFECSFDPEMMRQIPLRMDWFFGVCGFHSQILKRGGGILHASCIDAGGSAVLFTAVSQTGKSTQARLWNEVLGAQIINGDRALLRRREGVWYAYGYPCCGSSGICINRTLPAAAIVVLEQGTENRVEELSPSRKIRSLVSGMELYPWDQKEIDLAFACAQRIASEIRVVKLVCRPDAGAVEVLRDYLTGEGINLGL